MNADELIVRYACAWTGRQIDQVEPYATDWAGSTQDGFRSGFELYLKGPETYRHLEGQELGEFWAYVMRQPVPR